jgi:uncharacterized protein (DUF2235 family)
MPKNIVVLSDGTGQEGGRAARRNTNVYQMFQILEDRTPRQVVFYDPGLGTGWRKVTGNIAGAGLSRTYGKRIGSSSIVTRRAIGSTSSASVVVLPL